MAEGPQAQIVGGGSGWADGKFQAPPGWPEGAGWVVRDGPGGDIVDWGPAEDFRLVAFTDMADGSDGPLPPAEDLGIALKGLPVPPDQE